MEQKNQIELLSANLFEATQLVKSGDPELADMGRKWVKDLIWGEQKKVDVSAWKNEKVVEVMIGEIKAGKFPWIEPHVQPLLKKSVIEGAYAELWDNGMEYFDPHSNKWERVTRLNSERVLKNGNKTRVVYFEYK